MTKYAYFQFLNQMFTARSDHEEIVELLLKNGANVNIENNVKATPLILAARGGEFPLE